MYQIENVYHHTLEVTTAENTQLTRLQSSLENIGACVFAIVTKEISCLKM